MKAFMGHNHDHHEVEKMSDRGLLWAIGLNALLTVIEVFAGILSGSLSLIGDAIHNGSDAASLVIALIARRWSRRLPDERRTYGYRRASIVGAMINVTTLCVIGLYILYESIMRFVEPSHIDGWIMIVVAAIALLVDIGTVLFMRSMGKGLNIRAALAHNLADALASIAVIVAGIAILVWGIAWIDAALTALIAGFILYQSFGMLKDCIAILMDSVPPGCEPEKVAGVMQTIPGVIGAHHIHIRQLDDDYVLMEAHIVVDSAEIDRHQEIRRSIRSMLQDKFSIVHATLEVECADRVEPSGEAVLREGH